jgi:hypothetical protein
VSWRRPQPATSLYIYMKRGFDCPDNVVRYKKNKRRHKGAAVCLKKNFPERKEEVPV